MDFLQLKYFRELAYSQHVTELAEKLHISQPSLSITISKLEKELGIKLFDRVGRRIILNEYGEKFLNHVDNIFNELDYAIKEINELKKVKEKKIILATTGTLFLSNFIVEFLQKNQKLNIKQFIAGYEKAVELLEKGEIDFAITHPPIEEENIESVILFEDEILIALPENHPLSKKKKIKFKELKNEKFINLTGHYDFRKVANEIYEIAGFQPDIILEGELELLEKMLISGIGISLIPKKIIEMYSEIPFATLKLIEPEFKWTVGLSWLKGKYLSEPLKKFKDFILEYYNKTP